METSSSPPHCDLKRVEGLSPVLRHVRDGKRGAAAYEESIARGLRKARGQCVTPRKRRKGRGEPPAPPEAASVAHGPGPPGLAGAAQSSGVPGDAPPGSDGDRGALCPERRAPAAFGAASPGGTGPGDPPDLGMARDEAD